METKKRLLILFVLVAGCLLLIAPVITAETEEEPVVSTLFFQTDLREALGEVALQTGVNIIYDETVHGTVTLDLEDVPLSRALRMMLISGGYSYQKIEDFYLVGLPDPNSPTFREISTTETITLDYITADEVTDLIPDFYTNFISTSAQRENRLTITAPEAIIAEFKELLQQIDLSEKQILIKVLVTEVSTEVFQERGINFFQYLSEEVAAEQSLGLSNAFEIATGGSYGQLLAEIKALEGQEKAEIVADPQIRVTDRKSAELFVGEERILFLQPEDDDTIVEDVEVGISLQVTPRILNNNELQIDVNPDISHFSSETRDQLVIRRSNLSTSVYAKNAETISLAGMTIDERLEFDSGVPILRNIPLVRWLFGSSSEKTGERELLIFITPEIIEGG